MDPCQVQISDRRIGQSGLASCMYSRLKGSRGCSTAGRRTTQNARRPCSPHTMFWALTARSITGAGHQGQRSATSYGWRPPLAFFNLPPSRNSTSATLRVSDNWASNFEAVHNHEDFIGSRVRTTEMAGTQDTARPVRLRAASQHRSSGSLRYRSAWPLPHTLLARRVRSRMEQQSQSDRICLCQLQANISAITMESVVSYIRDVRLMAVQANMI